MSDILNKIGQLFILGFPGSEPSQAFLNFLTEEQIGGVILFAENCPTHLATRDTIQELNRSFSDMRPFIAIDQEGGRVCRLRGAPAEIQSAAYWGKKDNLEGFREVYGRAAVYMESLGINLNLFPVCDLLLDEDNVCLRDRCYGSDPETVAEFVKAAVETSRSNGLFSCLKHFPGLGAARIDPHVQTAGPPQRGGRGLWAGGVGYDPSPASRRGPRACRIQAESSQQERRDRHKRSHTERRRPCHYQTVQGRPEEPEL